MRKEFIKPEAMTKDNELNVTTNVKESVWADFVRNHPKGSIFQTPEMYEVYKSTKRYEPVFLAAVDESDNVKAMLVAHVIKEFESVLGRYSARAIIQGGPLYEETGEGFDALKMLMGHYNRVASQKALSQCMKTVRGCTSKLMMEKNCRL